MNESIVEIERVFMALADKTRLRLLYLMRNGEVSVNYLCEKLKTSQPKVSRHLAYLRSMNIVHTRRNGKWIFYSLNLPESRIGSQVLIDTLEWTGTSIDFGQKIDERYSSAETASDTVKASGDSQNIYARTNISRQRQELEIYLL